MGYAKRYLDEEGFRASNEEVFSTFVKTPEFQSFLTGWQFGLTSEEEFYEFMSRKIGDIAAYDLIKTPSRTYEERVLETLKDLTQGNERVLDIGCGTGLEMVFIAEHLPGEVIGIDISKAMLDVTKERVERRKINNIGLIQADREVLPFPDSAFDSVICYNSLVSIQDERERDWPGGEIFFNRLLNERLKEIWRVTKQGGKLVLSLPLQIYAHLVYEKTKMIDILEYSKFKNISTEHLFLNGKEGMGSLLYVNEKV